MVNNVLVNFQVNNFNSSIYLLISIQVTVYISKNFDVPPNATNNDNIISKSNSKSKAKIANISGISLAGNTKRYLVSYFFTTYNLIQ